MESKQPIVELEHISKRFGDTQALADVSLAILTGDIHALVGENGAGKSTLGKIIGGVYRPDAGRLRIGGLSTSGWTTRRALTAGVATIQQELALVPDLSVARNVFLGIETHRLGVIQDDLSHRYRALDDRVGFGLDPDTPVRNLRIADQQKVEILRALARDARVIIMDEPASSLTADETSKLHHMMKTLQTEGRTIIYVTHFLDAVFAVCDRVSVMRDGHLMGTNHVSETNTSSLIEEMIGRPLEISFPPLPPVPGPTISPALELREVSSGRFVHRASLVVHPGEIVGLAGLVGSGRSEIARVIFGADRLDGGEILLHGQPYRHPTPQESIRRKLVMIPEDRRRQGLVLSQSVSSNISLPYASEFSRFGVVSLKAERRAAQTMIQTLDLHPPRADLDVMMFSGGNQQKVLFAKWMVSRPRVVLLDEPTRGVDIGAKQHIYRVIGQIAADGAAVLLISSELEEVIGLSHRVYLVREGQIIGEVDPRSVTVDDILFHLFGISHTAVERAAANGES